MNIPAEEKVAYFLLIVHSIFDLSNYIVNFITRKLVK